MSLSAHNYYPLTDPGEEPDKSLQGHDGDKAESDDEVAEAALAYERKDFNLILIFTFILAMKAGIVNALTILITSNAGFPPFTSSHHTGTVTRIGISIGRHYFDGGEEAWNWSALAIAFAFGAATSGFWIRTEVFHPNRKYGLLLVWEGLFLFATAFAAFHFLERRDAYSACMNRAPVFGEDSELCNEYRTLAMQFAALGSYACGLQNALCTNLTGAVVRTTHMTGLLTDLGLLIGQSIRFFSPWRRTNQDAPQFWRFKIFLLIFWGFVFGCAISTKGYDVYADDNSFRAHMVDFTAAFFIVFGLIWFFKRLDRRYRTGYNA
jgi:uncharacterized membrane protein YoaK (UPF0700 family)